MSKQAIINRAETTNTQECTDNAQGPIMYVGIPCPVWNTGLRVPCAGCGALFVPTGRQKYCDHSCYVETLRVSIEDRFWTKVNKTSDCWLWTAATIRGYGQISRNRKPAYAHRVAWELANGPIPSGLEVLHRCDVPLCVRPDHLFLGSQQDNLADARQKGRLDETRARRTSVLSPWDRLAIYNTRSYRGICVALARSYGVTKACISAIRKGRFTRPVDICNVERVPTVELPIYELRELLQAPRQILQPRQLISSHISHGGGVPQPRKFKSLESETR